MLKRVLTLAMMTLLAATLSAQDGPRKIFISVDMEGITGVVSSQQSGSSGRDYETFRRIMTEEVNAAIKAALRMGAETILVCDAHGNKQNILPELLHPAARLVRGDPRPLGMMQGLDETFDAAMFIGYHAWAGTSDAVLDHTMNSRIYDLRLDGNQMSEGTFNAALAGSLGVPVIFVSGDRAAVDQIREFVGDVEGAVVKEGVEQATISVSPERALEMIDQSVERAMRRYGDFKPYSARAPHTVEIDFSSEAQAGMASWVPSVSRVTPRSVRFSVDNMLDAMRMTRLLAIYVSP